MELITLVIALIGAVTGSIALGWQILNDVRKVQVVFLGSCILLINHTRRPVNIDAAGFIYEDGTSFSIIEPKFESICTIPAEDQKDVDLGSAKYAVNAKYAYARDVCGKKYRTKIHKEDISYFLNQGKNDTSAKS